MLEHSFQPASFSYSTTQHSPLGGVAFKPALQVGVLVKLRGPETAESLHVDVCEAENRYLACPSEVRDVGGVRAFPSKFVHLHAGDEYRRKVVSVSGHRERAKVGNRMAEI